MATGLPKSKADGPVANQTPCQAGGGIRLDYQGKRSPAEIIAGCPRAALAAPEPPKHRPGWTNRLYFGDNLGILGTLLDDTAVRGRVSLVYIDPPYSTNCVFESRQQRIAYHDLISGAAYVESLRERLVLLRELLSARGSMYVHLDENMVFPMKLVLDEVFGADNFRNFITRKKCNTKNYTRRAYGNVADYILFYSRSETYVWNRPVITWSEERARSEYAYVEPSTGRRFKKVPVHAPGVRNGETGKPWRGMLPPPGKHWQFPPSVLDEMDRRGEVSWSSNGNPRRKIYLDSSAGIPVQDIWLDFKDAHNQNIEITGYPTEKNIEMLEQIVSASSEPGDLVLDCFAGSGTTLVAAGNLGRRWIGIDNSHEAISTIVNRLRFGTKPMGDYVKTKRAPAAGNHPELFDLPADTKQGNATEERVTDFCLYQAADVPTFRTQPDSAAALREGPTGQESPKRLQTVTYGISRRRPAKKRGGGAPR
jgi:adenine-specific DNA-methyltransferase